MIKNMSIGEEAFIVSKNEVAKLVHKDGNLYKFEFEDGYSDYWIYKSGTAEYGYAYRNPNIVPLSETETI